MVVLMRAASDLRKRPIACVIGTVELVRPLGIAGIPCALVAQKNSRWRYSRYIGAIVERADPLNQPQKLVSNLIRFANSQPVKPVLFYEHDADLLMVSRFRDALGEAFRFVLPDAELVESLVDKGRFQELANRLGLPVPGSQLVVPKRDDYRVIKLEFPIIIKPRARQISKALPWDHRVKAIAVPDRARLDQLWQKLAKTDMEFIVQELISGPETCIESYHAYVDAEGNLVAEFTGRKVRTFEPTFGFSTALVTTSAPDVIELGRDVLQRLSLRGVAKLDLKRGPDGRLWLLEVNPRFNLWHHVGARAGVNIPALVYDDLTGVPRQRSGPARPGIRWCSVREDYRAARAANVPLLKWILWVLGCEARILSIDDPIPIILGLLNRRISDSIRQLPVLRRFL
jgi:predicted ATP-grasp superfamily ATP-dependent carboligase